MGIIYTSTYKYSGNDRLDITVKGQSPIGKLFAPTWDMVLGYKNGRITPIQYSDLYRKMMEESVRKNWVVWKNLLDAERITLVCFCRPGTFCHRHLLANMLQSLGADLGGEI
jgi:hypothetical protein